MDKIALARLASNTKVVVASASVASFIAGAAVASVVVSKKLERDYEEIIRAEVLSARTFYKKLYKKDEFSTPPDLNDAAEEESELLTDAVQALESYQGASEDDSEESSGVKALLNDIGQDAVPSEVTTNIFDKEDDEWDWSEIDQRDPTQPYVIHHDEFMQGEKDYEQQTVTYFEGDDVLTDERDGRIDDVDDTVGEDNLMKFGHGSKDNNVVYVRNDRMCVDFEIMRSTGKYSEQVLGFIEHSDSRKPIRRFRSDDE